MAALPRVSVTSGVSLPADLKIAGNPWARFWGLMGRKSIAPHEALLIKPCSSIHTFFMRFPIDVAFVDRSGTVVKTRQALKPWRVLLGGKGAHAVLELPAGGLRRHNIVPGATLQLS